MMNALPRIFHPEMLYEFLNPPDMGRTDTPYALKLPVITKILDVFYRQFYGGHHQTYYAGNIPDPTSGLIRSSSYQTDKFWFQYHGNSCWNWEALYDTRRPNTRFMFIADGGDPGLNIFRRLRELHKEENLFLNGPVSFLAEIGYG